MNVLLTNDDGVQSRGLRALYKAFTEAGHRAFAVAPARQQSGVSHALTVFEPLRGEVVDEADLRGYAVHGTPVDCVKLGLGKLAPFKPDLVVSGINQGPNSGPDIIYSGTVGAAAEGAFAGFPSLAISHGDHRGCAYIDKVARHAVKLAEKIDWRKIPKRRVINLNYPDVEPDKLAGVKVCPQGEAAWDNGYCEKSDPRGASYWWLACELARDENYAESDRGYLEKGYATLTPLRFNYTDAECMEILADMAAADGAKS